MRKKTGTRNFLIYEENVRVASGIHARNDLNVFEELIIFSTNDGEYDDSKQYARIVTSQCGVDREISHA